MKTYRYKKPRIAALLAAMTIACTLPTYAQTVEYIGTGSAIASGTGATNGNWTDVNSWSTGSVPTSTSDVVFNSPTNPSTNNILVWTSASSPSFTSARSFTFNNTIGAVHIQNQSTSGGRPIYLGSGGITLSANSLGVTFGASSRTVNVRATTDQTWTNNSASNLTITNAWGATDIGNSPVTVTISTQNAGNINFSNATQDGANGAVLSLIVDSAPTSTGIVNFANHSGTNFSGGITVKSGIVANNATYSGATPGTLGSGTVKLAASAGRTATIRQATSNAITTNFATTGTGGSNVMEFTSTTGGNLTGNLHLDAALNIGVRTSTNGTVINGVISGSGDLIKGQYQGGNSGTLFLAGANTYSGNTIVNNGAFTLTNTGSLTFYIGENGISNSVTGTSTGLITFNGTFNFDFSGADRTQGNTWAIVSSSLTNVTYGDDFKVNGFYYNAEKGVWTDDQFEFSTASGLLTYSAVPEPSTYALLAGAGALVLGVIRRRKAARV